MTFDELNEIISGVSGKKAKEGEDISALKLSSLELMRICAELEEREGISIDVKRLKGILTFDELAEYVTVLSETVYFDISMKDGEEITYAYDEETALDYIYYRLLKDYEGDRLSEGYEVKERLKGMQRGDVLTFETFKVKKL